MTTAGQIRTNSLGDIVRPAHNSHLPIGAWLFRLRLNDAIDLPIDKGSSFHGALGQALAKISTNLRDYFYNPTPPAHWRDSQQAPPRPYVLLPPLDGKTHYPAGDSLDLGIVLYGTAVGHLPILFAAIEHLGEFLGLGKPRGRFGVDSILQLGGQGWTPLYQDRHWQSAIQAISSADFFTDPPVALPHLTLRHISRLRLKADNDLLRTAPPFALLLNRLLGRINALATLYGNGVLLEPERKAQLLELAETIQIAHSTLNWQDWQRHSQHKQQTMPFGGLLGETIYSGELAPFVPWLRLGQWVGVGGKTSFGLGMYQLELMK